MSLDEYKLSAELLGHSLDVRAVSSYDSFIVSGSRDKTAKIWEQNGYVCLSYCVAFQFSACAIWS